jgi:hypothetical protein
MFGEVDRHAAEQTCRENRRSQLDLINAGLDELKTVATPVKMAITTTPPI